MTIRKTLLIAFVLVSLIPSLVVTALAFFTADHAMRREINRSLMVQPAVVSEQIDNMLFERVQNAITWRRLEVMQEIQIKDVDKRLSLFLAELKNGYRDVYHELACIDPSGRVVASSNVSEIGQIIPKKEPMIQIDEHVMLESLKLTDHENQGVLTIQSDIASAFKSGNAGELLLRFNWAQIYRVLDQAAQAGRIIVLVDKHNRIIAASASLREQGMLLKELPANWLIKGARGGVVRLNGDPFNLSEVMVGFDRSRGFQHFRSFGWTTLVIQPSHQAFIPVQRMALLFVIMLAITSTIAILLSFIVAGRIAKPITNLTAFTRRFMHDKKLPPVPDDPGGEVGELNTAFVQTVRDLDQSRQDLVRASKLAVLGELSAVIAHEVRTPLGILRSSAQILAREPSLGEEAHELIGFIESETERLNSLVSTLLDSARPRASNFVIHDLHSLILHAVGLLAGQAEKKNIRIDTNLNASNANISCDIEQMTQVLLNLILNALQILSVGGHILITTRDTGQKLLVEISDDGPGMLSEDQTRVFDPFFSRRTGGIGLGLSVVQQIVASHGGDISAGKSLMGGAMFTITLPDASKI